MVERQNWEDQGDAEKIASDLLHQNLRKEDKKTVTPAPEGPAGKTRGKNERRVP